MNTHGCKEPQEAARRAGQCANRESGRAVGGESQKAKKKPKCRYWRCTSNAFQHHVGWWRNTSAKAQPGATVVVVVVVVVVVMVVVVAVAVVVGEGVDVVAGVVAVGAANVVVEHVGAGKASAGVTLDDVEVDVVVACERRVSLKKRL